MGTVLNFGKGEGKGGEGGVRVGGFLTKEFLEISSEWKQGRGSGGKRWAQPQKSEL